MSQLHVTTTCYNYMSQLHVTTTCYNYMYYQEIIDEDTYIMFKDLRFSEIACYLVTVMN